MVQQSRLASAVALLAGAASAAAAVNFVTSPSSVAAPRAPRLGLSALGSAADDFAPMAGEQPEVEAQEAISPLKWLAAGLCAGVIFAASSALVEAKLPTGPEWDLATKAKAPWLQPCKDNKKYHKKFKDAIYKLQTRQKKYTTGGVIAKRFDLEIAQTKRVEEAYGNRLCGKADGTPRTIASGENVRGSIVIPGLMFLYTAGWIGWAGRSYLNRTKSAEKEMFIEIPLALTCMASGFAWPVNAWQEKSTALMFLYTAGWIGWAGRSYLNRTKSAEKEMFIEIPLALTCMASGFAWPVNAWQEIVNGQMTVPDSELYQSGQAAKGDY
eukprot:CAMPEP_0183599104 /NCGR_PEP_ID=MMETSP0371-20130417/179264_1 /TAXON_ID=268820 /ORGANISM="Peridinium aciculiferum, Strain PAER-2" /LENGTH=325 /DNA_ID=CAMNT_0025811167 /DNA_START=55 /DNA_END=1033 /DNA_ORIENTATION=+